MLTGTVFNIQRFSIHDGPGIRTTVFLSGCPLRCFWCHNPEGLTRAPQIEYYPERCIQCGECILTCQHGGHKAHADGHVYDRAACVACGACVAGCCSGAIQMEGQTLSTAQVLEEVLRDRAFYRENGGVTISGGEPLLQRDFSIELLKMIQAEGVQTAIETTAFFPWDAIAEVLPFTNLVMMDLKHLDSEKHRAATGVPNQRILENARHLARTALPLIFRTPLVPGVNDTVEDIAAIARFIAQEVNPMRPICAPPAQYELLPFHGMAGDKYRALGLSYAAADLNTPPKAQLDQLLAAAQSYVPLAICR